MVSCDAIVTVETITLKSWIGNLLPQNELPYCFMKEDHHKLEGNNF